jgi:hypothetical protein
VPQPVLDAAHDRASARAARDWATADRLRAEIEVAGWRIVDSGTDFRLEPAHPPDIETDAGVLYGRSDAVPSRLAEVSTRSATVVLVATDQPDDMARAVASLRAMAPSGTQLVVVADGPDETQAARLPAPGPDAAGRLDVEAVRTSARLGVAAAWNIGLRRATGQVVIVMDSSVELTGDAVTPLAAALADPGVAVVGPFGLRSADLRRFEEVTSGNAAAIEGYLLAVRRADAAAAGPVDEGFRFFRSLDIWWSLVLRDRGEEAPLRAVVVPDLPLVRHEHPAWTSVPDAERERLSRRNVYRLLERFRGRRDLAVS